MHRRVFIIHGWEDTPHNGWFPWLKKELVRLGIEVHAPTMPDASHPMIDVWVPFLQHLVGTADAHTYFVGHSIGCQTILRYAQSLPDEVHIGGAILVAGWVTLKPAALEDEDAAAVALPWIQRPLDWPKIRRHLPKVTAILSDDDQFVPVEDGKVFVRELHAQLIIEHQKRHLGGFDGLTTLPSALRSLEALMRTT